MFNPKRVAIIGGAGQMGRWFAKFFKDQGCSVVISGRRWSRCLKVSREFGVGAEKSHRDAIRGADLIIISVMADRIGAVAREIGQCVPDGQMVIDVTSVKELPVKVMHRYLRRATVLGTHPMFGPSAATKGQNIVLTPTNNKERAFASKLGAYLRSRGFRITVMSPKVHDEMIGAMLSLTHFVGFVTADTWRALGIGRFMKSSSTSFRFLKSFVESIVGSSPELYSYLQVSVPSAHRAERIFVERSRAWNRMASSGDSRSLIKRMSELEKYLKDIE